MTKKLCIIAISALVLIGTVIFGVTNYWERKAEIEDELTPFTVYSMKRNEYGYTPNLEFKMSRSTLEAHVKLCDHETSVLPSGDLLIDFAMEENKHWIVKISDPADIRWIRRIDS